MNPDAPALVAPVADTVPAAVRAPLPTGWRRVALYVHDLLMLTKYRITLVALFTGYTAIVVEGSASGSWSRIWPCLVALYLTGGGANTLNQVFEADKDGRMQRTRHRRPIPSGRISKPAAVVFAGAQIVAAQAILLGIYDSPLAALCSLITVGYYSFFYTLYLKPRHYLNIVIGGVPGAMGPLIAWSAITGGLSIEAWAMFAIIFLWTPPHFWALAIKLKNDYAAAGIPMLPVVKGNDETTRQIFIYTIVLVAFTLLLPLLGHGFGPLSLVVSIIGGAVFIGWSWKLWRTRPMPPSMPLFHYSIAYIALLFIAIVFDALAQARAGVGPA